MIPIVTIELRSESTDLATLFRYDSVEPGGEEIGMHVSLLRKGNWLAAGFIACSALFAAHNVSSHGTAGAPGDLDKARLIEFPDTATFKTLVVDLHTHSVFSDGHVWPNVRVSEAQRDGLDALAITEHIEYQPHLEQLPHPDRNAAYNEAATAAQGSDLIVISGSEITRAAPAGHMNAVFVEDSNRLLKLPAADVTYDPGEFYQAAAQWPPAEAVRAANEQGAFVFWNHPWWSSDTPDSRTRITDFHTDLVRRGELHGIELVNGGTYNEEAHQIALDHDLVLLGTSDVHNLIDWDYTPHAGGHRPVTLVLAEEHSADSLKEALFAGRTIVWFKNLLIGREAHLQPLLQASLTMENARYHPTNEIVLVTLVNHSDAHFRLRHTTTANVSFGGYSDMVDVSPHATIEMGIKPAQHLTNLTLEFEVLNALTAPNTHPRLTLQQEVTQRPGTD